MYGMIHQAARSLVLDSFGPETWSDVQKATGVGEEAFVSTATYADSETLGLVAAIAARLNITIPEALTAFGRYWITYTERTTFAPVMRISGDTLEEFLGNLDRMHASIKVAIPQTDLPSFRIVAEGPTGLDVLYKSNREGLEPFVTGLFEGLMRRFGVDGQVAFIGPVEQGSLFRFTYEREGAN